MELFLIRHALAEDGEDDDARPLTEKGKKRFKEMARALERMDVRFDRVLHSPKVRAVETAKLIDARLQETPLLAAPPADGLLQLFSTGNVVGAVGHEPWLSELLAWLVTGKAALGPQFELKKGAVAHLEGEPRPGQMQLKALLTPKAMRV